MQVGNVNIPCGCEARKEIMFTQGKPGVTEAVILGVPILALAVIILWKVK